nr:hypothetical protein [Tanacetum cinerariifolium]
MRKQKSPQTRYPNALPNLDKHKFKYEFLSVILSKLQSIPGMRVHCQTWTSKNSNMSSYRYANALPNLDRHKFKYEFLPVI